MISNAIFPGSSCVLSLARMVRINWSAIDISKILTKLYEILFNFRSAVQKPSPIGSPIPPNTSVNSGVCCSTQTVVHCTRTEAETNPVSSCDGDLSESTNTDSLNAGELGTFREMVQEFYRYNSNRINGVVVYGTSDDLIPEDFQIDPLTNYKHWSSCIN